MDLRSLLIVVIVSCSVLSARTSSASDSNFPREIPEVVTHVDDSIGALDFAIADDRLDAVWIKSPAGASPGDGRPSTQLWHRQLELHDARWGKPSMLAQDVLGPVRTITADGRLDVFVGPHLSHFQLSGRGVWSTRPDLTSAYAVTFDAAAIGNKVLLVYLVRLRGGSSERDSIEVWATVSGNKGLPFQNKLGTFPGGPTQPEPKLLLVGGTYHLFVAINRVARTTHPDSLSEDCRIIHFSSGDSGAKWSSPQILGVLGILGHKARPEGSGYVSHIDATYYARRIFVLYNASWLYMMASDGTRWSDPSVLIGARTWVGSARNRSVAIASDGNRGKIFWIDERFQHTDRSLINPLGLHWLADPDWTNNDVLEIPVSALKDAAAGKTRPVRLTRDLSFADRIRAQASNGRVYAMWSGRVKVGRELGSYGKPPTIFLLSLPPN